jgi:hypothetical protein
LSSEPKDLAGGAWILLKEPGLYTDLIQITFEHTEAACTEELIKQIRKTYEVVKTLLENNGCILIYADTDTMFFRSTKTLDELIQVFHDDKKPSVKFVEWKAVCFFGKKQYVARHKANRFGLYTCGFTIDKIKPLHSKIMSEGKRA